LRNYLKYFNNTFNVFKDEYDLTHNQLMFLLFISDNTKSFTRKDNRNNFLSSGVFYDNHFKKLVDMDYIFLFEARAWNSRKPNKYRVTYKAKRLVNKFYDSIEGKVGL